ncbi:ABC transporter substrate-binding protein [Sapientia aquatica]|uniref:ABC transporter substrate-binding protein n=1 Tax=Sapientia aquatica TaxID=1549640 RepID=A0A4R5VYA2_9BURK|nr:ABC transporter substrate-binding protein [Sapientia aquatica]TDK64480.1 ABC transporter substrate-binding protein [Sapientia aquatica]
MTDSTLLNAFCPTGKLRASINLGNPVLANLDASGQAVGVSVDLSNELAARLGVALELVVFNKAAQSVQAVSDGQADIGFFAIDPVRGAEIAFTHPYVLIEGFYLVPNGSSIMNNADVDRSEHRVVVGSGSAYDLFLSRELKLANIVRASSSQTVVSTFIESNAEVAAGVRQQLEADISNIDGFRLLGERFMTIQQAMGLPKTRGAAAAQYLQQFVEQMKASGFVANALQRHGIDGASVAPLA